MIGDDEEDRTLLRDMGDEARAYLEDHDWCERVADLRVCDGVGGIVAVCRARIVPARDGVDDDLWVVVGDIPPLYLVTDDIATPKDALEAYVGWRRDWVEAVRADRPLDNLPPVDAPATRANADDLATRLDFLESRILVEWE